MHMQPQPQEEDRRSQEDVEDRRPQEDRTFVQWSGPCHNYPPSPTLRLGTAGGSPATGSTVFTGTTIHSATSLSATSFVQESFSWQWIHHSDAMHDPEFPLKRATTQLQPVQASLSAHPVPAMHHPNEFQAHCRVAILHRLTDLLSP